MRRSTRPEPISAPSSKTSTIEADCIPRSATNPRSSSKPNSAKPKPSERTQPKLCHSNPVSQPRGAVHLRDPSCSDDKTAKAGSPRGLDVEAKIGKPRDQAATSTSPSVDFDGIHQPGQRAGDVV